CATASFQRGNSQKDGRGPEEALGGISPDERPVKPRYRALRATAPCAYSETMLEVYATPRKDRRRFLAIMCGSIAAGSIVTRRHPRVRLRAIAGPVLPSVISAPREAIAQLAIRPGDARVFEHRRYRNTTRAFDSSLAR